MAINSAVQADLSLNQRIDNIVRVEYKQSGRQHFIESAPASFTVAARPTSSRLQFFRYAPGLTGSRKVRLVPTRYSLSGTYEGPFSEIGPAMAFPDTELDLSRPVPLVPVENYLAEDLLIIGIEDPGQNINSKVSETIHITMTVNEGDSLVLELTEDGSDSGWFFAYVPTFTSAPGPSRTGFHLRGNDHISVRYTDAFTHSEEISATIFISSMGQVLDAFTEQPVNQVKLALFDAQTGQPAEIYGRDMRARYPSEVMSGETVHDTLGAAYEMQPGQFLFPFLKKGRYTLQVETPDHYVFPSLIRSVRRHGGQVQSQKSTGGVTQVTFDLTENGTLSFSVPIDPASDILVEKSTRTVEAAIGDFVPYQVSVTNRGQTEAYVKLRDVAPFGFRLSEAFLQTPFGSQPIKTDRQSDARIIDFDLGRLPQGGKLDLTYVMQIVAGARPGRQVNEIYQLDGRGEIASNIARADVQIREDLLRSKGIITGTVKIGACGSSTSSQPAGLAGVDLYMETGAYVRTDSRGKFHFEQVEPGAHIVHLDAESLPDAYELVQCSSSTRHAGSAQTQFAELTGGAISHLIFHVRRVEADDTTRPEQTKQPSELVSQMPETSDDTSVLSSSLRPAKSAAGPVSDPLKRFDTGWLNFQTNESALIYPEEDHVLASPALNLVVKHANGLSMKLLLNGRPVSVLHRRDQISSSDMQRVLSVWRGIDLQEGKNEIEIVLSHANGELADRLKRVLNFTSALSRAVYLPEQSVLIADGRTPPEIAIQLLDAAGQPVHVGRFVNLDVGPPYQLYQQNRLEDELGLTTSLAAQGVVSVGPGGIARIRLEPTLRSGPLSLRVQLDDKRDQTVQTQLVSASRPWIVAGLAEGQVGRGADPGTRYDADPLSAPTDFYNRGRLAVFAQGTIDQDWQVMLGLDTDKRRDQAEDGFNLELDPTASYTQFGDRSYQQFAAASQYPLYARIEKGRTQALFGDFQTGLTETELSSYSRQLSGLQLNSQSEQFSLKAFAAETEQQYLRAELAADGTSGPYRLVRGPVLPQTERITIETRDRHRPDQTLRQRSPVRYIDYDIDYETGEIIFRSPIAAADPDFNPNVIIIEYETLGQGDGGIMAGGRLEFTLPDQAMSLGFSVIREDASGPDQIEGRTLTGLDLRLALGEDTRLRAEYARTDLDGGTSGSGDDADAMLIELDHASDQASLLAYFRQENTQFGLGQQSGATADIRRYGAKLKKDLSVSDDPQTGERSIRRLTVDAYEEVNLTNGNARQVSTLSLQQSAPSLSWDTGLTYARDQMSGQEATQSILLNTSARKQFRAQGLMLMARHEQALGGDQDVPVFPQRTLIGLDKSLTDHATLNLRHETSHVAGATNQTARIGLTLTPWSGAELRSALDQRSTESGRRLAATMGLDQAFSLTDELSAGFGFSQRFDLQDGQAPRNLLPVRPLSPLDSVGTALAEASDTFRSGYAGLGYRTDQMAVSGRIEFRESAEGLRHSFSGSAARQMNAALSFAGRLRYQHTTSGSAPLTDVMDVRLGLAYRPDDDGLIVFNRLDLKQDHEKGVRQDWKLVNNLTAHKQLGEKLTLAAFLGTKYAEITLNDRQYRGWTHLIGADLRRDLNQKWDIGLAGSALYSDGPGALDYALGLSLGHSPADHIWVSLGYNFDGLRDRDFEASEYARSGPFIKFRLKFNETTLNTVLGELLDRLD